MNNDKTFVVDGYVDPRLPGKIFLGATNKPNFMLRQLEKQVAEFAAKASERVSAFAAKQEGGAFKSALGQYARWLLCRSAQARKIVSMTVAKASQAPDLLACFEADDPVNCEAFLIAKSEAEAYGLEFPDAALDIAIKRLSEAEMLFCDEARRRMAQITAAQSSDEKAQLDRIEIELHAAASRTIKELKAKSQGGRKGAREKKRLYGYDDRRKTMTAEIVKIMKMRDTTSAYHDAEGKPYSNMRIYRMVCNKVHNKDENGESYYTPEQIKEWFKPSKRRRGKGRK
ncbi:MAG: hypothetical protein IJQ34_07180 [Kiritimatiellae bacterium]|nr:hypothetical protein [Kiritimatiellia bacterium]MBR0197900.1 hypothetical protein [Kiritimatiellia bacterium]